MPNCSPFRRPTIAISRVTPSCRNACGLPPNKLNPAISGQCSLLKPGASSEELTLQISKMNLRALSSNPSTLHGTMKSLSPIPRNPPNESTT